MITTEYLIECYRKDREYFVVTPEGDVEFFGTLQKAKAFVDRTEKNKCGTDEARIAEIRYRIQN